MLRARGLRCRSVHPLTVSELQALVSVFRTRLGADPSRDRDRDTSIERCDVAIDDGPGKKSRFTATIVCRNGSVQSLPSGAR